MCRNSPAILAVLLLCHRWALFPWAMANRISQNISLTAELSAFIASRVASGDYQSASEVVRAALRLLQREETSSLPEQHPPQAARTRHARR